MHPWANPPITGVTDDFSSHAVNLDINLFREKLNNLTMVLQDVLSTHPYSFRSGRWGMNEAMMRVLRDSGYRVDSSVRPFYNDTAFNYQTAKTYPYFPSFENILMHDEEQKDILEIPSSSGFNRAQFELLNKFFQLVAQVPKAERLVIGSLNKTGLVSKITVTPEAESAKDVIKCMDMIIARGERVINLFFHSSNLLPGATPYVRTEKDREQLLSTVAQCVDHAREKYNARFVTMREADMILRQPVQTKTCLLYTSPSPRDATLSRMPSSA